MRWEERGRKEWMRKKVDLIVKENDNWVDKKLSIFGCIIDRPPDM